MRWGFERDGLALSSARENCKLQIARSIESISVIQLDRLIFKNIISQTYHIRQTVL